MRYIYTYAIYIYICDIYIYGMCIYMWHVYIYICTYMYSDIIDSCSKALNVQMASAPRAQLARRGGVLHPLHPTAGSGNPSVQQLSVAQNIWLKKNIYIFIDIYVVKMFAIVWNIVYIHKYTQNCTKLWQNCSKLWL